MTAFRFSAEGVGPELGDCLAGECGGERGEPHAVVGHLVEERGGQAGLGCQLQREAGQVGQFRVAGDGQVNDPGEGCGEQLVQGRPDGGLVRGAAGQFDEQLSQECGFPLLADGEPGGGGGQGGQLRGVGQVLLGQQVRSQRVPVAGACLIICVSGGR